MQREIAITELKPVLAAQRSHRAHEAPALGFTAPALRGIGLAGQRIEQRIDVRRDREPEMLEIVAGIDDGRYRSRRNGVAEAEHQFRPRSEEHTSELQSLMRISYAVFCLKKKQHTRRSLKWAEEAQVKENSWRMS